MATADVRGPFEWPLIDGMVAVNGAGGVAVESKRLTRNESGNISLLPVIPAKAGIQGSKASAVALDPHFRGGDV
jgi:hypothetical protein